jgi:YidC/Oxa1 family membrane protein insertase
LYWQYGLVLYWVTTNLWTLGQQYFMFRNWTTEPVGADSAVAGATTGGSARATQSSVRPQRQGSGAAKAAGAAGAAKAASGGSRTGTASGRTASGSSGSGSARPKDGTTSASSRTSNGSGGARTGTTSRPATAAPRPATGQNGTEKRGLFGLGRAKPEPEPQDDVPAAKVVRQQPVRQAKSKRSGNKR